MGSRVPTELLPTAIRYEHARAVLFDQFGQHSKARECEKLKRYYERRSMDESAFKTHAKGLQPARRLGLRDVWNHGRHGSGGLHPRSINGQKLRQQHQARADGGNP